MWKIALAALVAVVVAVATPLGLAATRPSTFRVERSAILAAPSEVVLHEISDLREWPRWSPWGQSAAPRQRTFGGPLSAPGASYYWSAADEPGPGRLTVLAVTSLQVELELERHGRSPADMAFDLAAAGAGTQVTWSLSGERSFRERLLALFRNPDVAIAADLQRGLLGLQAVVEARAPAPTCRVARSTRVEAPPGAVMAQIADLRRWGRWSPWEPTGMGNRSYGGPETGPGASYYWGSAGDGQQGRLTILDVGPDRLEVELDVAGAASDLEFRLTPEPGGTRVTMAMAGEATAPETGAGSEADAACGSAFEKGLSRLKGVVEAAPGSGL